MSMLQAQTDQRDDAKKYPVDHMTRQEYLKYFRQNYKNHHKSTIGPTQRGKTHESLQSLDTVITPDNQAVLFSSKPPHRDPVMNSAAEKLHLKVTEEWPPGSRYLDRKRGYRGYVLRPNQNLHPGMTIDEYKAGQANVRTQFQRAMLDCYGSHRQVIQLHDEAHKTQNNYKLKSEYEAPLMSGLPESRVWSNIQRGRYVSYLSFDAPEWILFFQEPDRANTIRYAQMVGGVNRHQVADIVEGLKTYELKDGTVISEFLLVRRAGPRLIIVDIE